MGWNHSLPTAEIAYIGNRENVSDDPEEAKNDVGARVGQKKIPVGQDLTGHACISGAALENFGKTDCNKIDDIWNTSLSAKEHRDGAPLLAEVAPRSRAGSGRGDPA